MIPRATDVEYTSWPLPGPLTRKIVGYLNIYRMVIAALLGVAHFGGLTESAVDAGSHQAFANAALGMFSIIAGLDGVGDTGCPMW